MIRYGQIWIGTETAGIVKLSPRPLMLRNYIHEDGHPGSLSHNPVNAMYVEADGTLWAGTVEGGLNRKGAGDTFSHWTTSNSPLSHNSVSVLEADGHGRLWIGTWGGGLNYISLEEHSQVHPVSMPPSMTSLTSYIGSLLVPWPTISITMDYGWAPTTVSSSTIFVRERWRILSRKTEVYAAVLERTWIRMVSCGWAVYQAYV